MCAHQATPPDGDGADSTYARHELKEEPIAQNDESRDRDEKYKDERQDPSARIKNDVGAHDAGDGATGSERGQSGVEVEEDVRETRANSADEIEEKVREVAEVVFHVVAEDPEEEHVTGYVEEAAMHEHAGEKGKEGGFEAAVTVEGESNVVGNGGIG